MSKNSIDNLFENIETNFDLEHPELGHQERFLQKLNALNSNSNRKKINLWKPFIGIAASIALLISLFIYTSKENNTTSLASISPEMAKTERMFRASLSKELENLNSEDMPEYQELIVDAIFDIKVIEEDYNQLILGLKIRPKNKLILDAMILNFQSRINILESTKSKIEALKKSDREITII